MNQTQYVSPNTNETTKNPAKTFSKHVNNNDFSISCQARDILFDRLNYEVKLLSIGKNVSPSSASKLCRKHVFQVLKVFVFDTLYK